MRTSIELVHQGRYLEIRAAMIAGDWQIWIHEGGNRIYLHGIVAGDQMDQVAGALAQARRDIETDAIIVPIVRSWPQADSPTNAR